MTSIVVSRRDGILRAPDGTKYRVARGKTLAEAEHPAVLANPGDWVPMTVTLTVDNAPDEGDPNPGSSAERLAQVENDVAELEETLGQREAELARLAAGLEAAGITLPAEDDREPGWLVDLAIEAVGAGLNALKAQLAEPEPALREGGIVKSGVVVGESGFGGPSGQAPPIAPPKPRKRTAPPLTKRTSDDG